MRIGKADLKIDHSDGLEGGFVLILVCALRRFKFSRSFAASFCSLLNFRFGFAIGFLP